MPRACRRRPITFSKFLDDEVGPRAEEDPGDARLAEPPQEGRVVRDHSRVQLVRRLEDRVVRLPGDLECPESLRELLCPARFARALGQPPEFIHDGRRDEDLGVAQETTELRLQVLAERPRGPSPLRTSSKACRATGDGNPADAFNT